MNIVPCTVPRTSSQQVIITFTSVERAYSCFAKHWIVLLWDSIVIFCFSIESNHFLSNFKALSSTDRISSRHRYADYKRSQSLHRNPASYWKNPAQCFTSKPPSREPSPTVTWSRPSTTPLQKRFYKLSYTNQSYSVSSGQVTPSESEVNYFWFTQLNSTKQIE